MTNRDKLVEIMLRYPRALCDHCGDDNWLEANAQQFADRLIANGVTVQPSPQNNHRKICPTTGLECIACVPGSPCAKPEVETNA